VRSATEVKEEIKMFNYSENFCCAYFAEKFAEKLESQGITEIVISISRDAFNEIQYTVKWNID
jgi:hypothetical protein